MCPQVTASQGSFPTVWFHGKEEDIGFQEQEPDRSCLCLGLQPASPPLSPGSGLTAEGSEEASQGLKGSWPLCMPRRGQGWVGGSILRATSSEVHLARPQETRPVGTAGRCLPQETGQAGICPGMLGQASGEAGPSIPGRGGPASSRRALAEWGALGLGHPRGEGRAGSGRPWWGWRQEVKQLVWTPHWGRMGGCLRPHTEHGGPALGSPLPEPPPDGFSAPFIPSLGTDLQKLANVLKTFLFPRFPFVGGTPRQLFSLPR